MVTVTMPIAFDFLILTEALNAFWCINYPMKTA